MFFYMQLEELRKSSVNTADAWPWTEIYLTFTTFGTVNTHVAEHLGYLMLSVNLNGQLSEK